MNLYEGWTSFVAQCVGAISPQMATNWVKSRMQLSAYTAATSRGPNAGWRPTNRSADNLSRHEHALIVSRARDLVRNSTHVSGALERIANNVIYTGIKPQAARLTDSGELDHGFNRKLEQHFKDWAEADEVGFDDIQRLILNHLWQDGECLLRFYPDPDLMKQGIAPLGVELLECDHLDSSVDGLRENGNFAIRGVEFNRKGHPVAYHLFSEHPGDMRRLMSRESVRVPAMWVRHIFMPKRASQHRGISWMAPVIMEMRDFSEFQDSHRIVARLMAAFGFFVETPYPELQNPLGLEDSDTPERPEAFIPDYVEPGQVVTLPSGSKVNEAQFNHPGTTYEPYVKTSLRGSSTGFGMSYEAFSNDYSDASYASARSATLEERRGYRVQQVLMGRKAIVPTWHMFARMLWLSQLEKSMTGPRVPVGCQYPGWPWVDPTKDANAAEKMLGMGCTTRRKICAERGEDYDEVVDQLDRENKDLKKCGIIGANNA